MLLMRKSILTLLVGMLALSVVGFTNRRGKENLTEGGKSMDKKINLWIDTDIGTDIDDALAIAFALSRREFNIIGISVTDSLIDGRLKTLQALLQGMGRDDIPVYRGWEGPLLRGRKYAGQVGFTYKAEPKGKYKGKVGDNAPQAILEAIKKLNGDLVLLSLGKMTNIAVAYLSDPATFRKLKRYVAMAGCFNSPNVEYNVVRDPYAMEIMLESGMKPLFVGLDVTMRCGLGKEDREKISESIPVLGDLINQFLKNAGWAKEMIILHDPLACAVILRGDLVKTEDRHLVVDLNEGEKKGLISSEEGEENGIVCVDVNVEEFVEFFTNSLTSFTLSSTK